MTVDWDEPLIPPGRSIRRTCTCPDAERNGACKHVIALAYVVAAAIDDDPSVLLEWRGCTTEEPQAPVTVRPAERRCVGRRRAAGARPGPARCPSGRC